MRRLKFYQRISFVALAVSIAVSLPLTARAVEWAEDCLNQTVMVTDIAVCAETEPLNTAQSGFLRSMLLVTHCGRPNQGTTRAQYIQLLYRAAGSPEVTGRFSFTDVPTDADYADALTWAEQAGVAQSDLAGHFRPDEDLTGEDAVAFLIDALAALGSSAQQVANGLLAAYTGKVSEEDWALTPEALLAVLDRIANEDAYTVEYPCMLAAAPPSHTGATAAL